MGRNQALPDGIGKSQLLLAAKDFDSTGMPPGYKPSHSYDVLINGRCYPPPAIVALGAKVLTGVLPESGFRAGKGSKCFQILEDAGFVIQRKVKDGQNP